MANRKKQILPTGGEQPKQISPQLQEVIQQTQVGKPVSLAPPEFISEEIEQQRQQLEVTGQMPADISSDQVMGGVLGGNLKLQNIAAKYFPKPAMEKLGREDFFPGFRPVQEVGAVSGRIIGRQPIFVRSGGLFPFGIIEARKRALERAAQVKLAARSAILEGGPEGPPQYDRELKSAWFDFVNDWGQKVNWDFTNIKGDPEFMRGASSFFTLAKEMKFMTGTSKDILDDSMSKEKFVPPDVEEFASKIWMGGLKFKEDIIDNPQKFIESSQKLQSYANLMNIIRTEGTPLFEDQVSELVPTIPDEAAKTIMRTSDYDVIVKTLKDHVDPELMEGWASLLKENFNLFQKQPEVKAALEKVIGNQVKQQLFATRKFNLASKSARRQPTAVPAQAGFFNVKDIKEVDVTKTVEGRKVTTKELKEEIVPIEFAGFFNIAGIKREPTKINIIPDVLHNTVDDRIERTLGTMNVDVIGVGPLATTEAGAIVFATGGKLPEDLSKFIMKDFAVVRVNEPTDITFFDRETKKEVTEEVEAGSTRLVPFEKVEQPLKNAKIRIEGNQLLFEGEPVGAEGGTFNLIFE
jgi:hypothetical protein